VGREGEKKPLRFDDFEILDLLGEGSFGRVFRVQKKNAPGHHFAMKSMKKQGLIQNGQIKYAVSEAAIMREQNHPYVLKLESTFQTPDYMHMVMEVCESGDLA
jgi:serine/threonine protein kinase